MQILAPPEDLGAWAAAAYVTVAARRRDDAPVWPGRPRSTSPRRRASAWWRGSLLRIPEAAGLEVFREDEKTEVRLKIDGVVEHEGELFEEFHIRYQVPITGEEPPPLVLLLDRLLRPGEPFLVRLKVHDEIGGGEARANLGFRVPMTAQAAADLPADVIVAQGVDVEPERVPGIDSLVIVPPETDVVLGLWRVETLISGERISKVVFLVDGKSQYTKTAAPFQAEVRLAKYPTEQVVRVEGYDSTDQLVAFDEVVLNQQRGQLEVRITEPKRGVATTGSVRAKASIVDPRGAQARARRVPGRRQGDATLAKPPWEADVPVPVAASENDVHYITVAAYLDDGTRAEDVQFLNNPDYLEEVDVDLVELYTTIEGQAPAELTKEEFSVFEDGRPQQIVKFELVRDLPITIGVTIDTSGSMIESIGEAKRAAIDFLQSIVTPKDQVFAVSFSNHPVLLMTRTSDVGAVAKAIDGLHAVGNTALHDAVVTSLYYFRGVRGRRALVLLSDGEDTSSTIQFKDALDYARRSGVVIYPIGLNIGMTAIGVRDKLNNLAQTTGGRAFYISKAVELQTVYDQIEEELRSQYLIAYASDAPRDLQPVPHRRGQDQGQVQGAHDRRVLPVSAAPGPPARRCSLWRRAPRSPPPAPRRRRRAEFEFARLNRTYSQFVDQLAAGGAGPGRGAAALAAAPARADAPSRLARAGGRGHAQDPGRDRAHAGAAPSTPSCAPPGSRASSTTSSTLPRQTLRLDGRIRLARSAAGYQIALVEAPESVEVLIQSQLAGRLVPVCRQMALVLVPLRLRRARGRAVARPRADPQARHRVPAADRRGHAGGGEGPRRYLASPPSEAGSKTD